MQRIFYTIITQSTQHWKTEDVAEAKQAFQSGWQVIKTTITDTFSNHTVVRVRIDTEITDISEFHS